MINMKHQLNQLVLPIGQITATAISISGSCFIVAHNVLCTAYHNVAGLDNIGIIMPKIKSVNDFQDYSDKSCNIMKLGIYKINPHRDIALLIVMGEDKGDAIFNFSTLNILDKSIIVGYPHSAEDTNGRNILTFQETKIGAKILLESEIGKVKNKNYILNIQSRPGQSGSPVFDKDYNLIAMVVGGFKYQNGSTINGIDPSSLNQTTYAISSEYIKEML